MNGGGGGLIDIDGAAVGAVDGRAVQRNGHLRAGRVDYYPAVVQGPADGIDPAAGDGDDAAALLGAAAVYLYRAAGKRDDDGFRQIYIRRCAEGRRSGGSRGRRRYCGLCGAGLRGAGSGGRGHGAVFAVRSAAGAKQGNAESGAEDKRERFIYLFQFERPPFEFCIFI